MRTITLFTLFVLMFAATGCSNSGPSSTEPVPRGNRVPTGTGPKAPR